MPGDPRRIAKRVRVSRMAADLKDTRRITTQIKAAHRRSGTDHCEICGWRPPIFPTYNTSCTGPARALHVHHILPRYVGGKDDPENLILLCPNHHAVAHGVSGLWITIKGDYVVTRERLVEVLHLADQDPTGWLDKIFPEHAALRAVGF